jgi:hypothetical protein
LAACALERVQRYVADVLAETRRTLDPERDLEAARCNAGQLGSIRLRLYPLAEAVDYITDS